MQLPKAGLETFPGPGAETARRPAAHPAMLYCNVPLSLGEVQAEP